MTIFFYILIAWSVSSLVIVYVLMRNTKALKMLAYTDSLTGLLNARGLHYKANHMLAQRNNTVYMLSIDLNDFKKINDTRGHAEGDKVLQAVASVLQAQTRAEDAVSRCGGDEFTVLLNNCTHVHATNVVQRIIDTQCDVGLSIGLCAAQNSVAEPNSYNTLKIQSDSAMYTAKTQTKLKGLKSSFYEHIF